MFAFYKEFSEWMGCYLQKSQGNPEYILHSSLVRRAIIYVCSTFVRVNSNQKSVLHLTENFSGRHCFTTVLASNIAKWKIKSHAPAEQHAAEYIYNDLQLPCPVRINPNDIFIWTVLAFRRKLGDWTKAGIVTFLFVSRWPNVTSRAPMEFKWRASGRQNLAVGLVKFHKGEKGRPTDIQSYTSYKYCSKLGVFITKMIYKHKFQGQWISNWRFNFFRKARRKKKSVERRMRKHARAYSKFYSELVQHDHYNESAKQQFQIQLISNCKLW